MHHSINKQCRSELEVLNIINAIIDERLLPCCRGLLSSSISSMLCKLVYFLYSHVALHYMVSAVVIEARSVSKAVRFVGM